MKRLYLSSTDKKWAGLCGGIAEYFHIDSTIVRLIWVILTVCSIGIGGLIIYLIGYLIIPRKPEEF